MRTVRGPDGDHYLLIKESAEASLVRDPGSGETRHLPNEEFEPVEGTSPLATAAEGVPEPVRTVLTAVRDDRSLGLLLTLADRGPTGVRTLLGRTDLCESDLHGLVAEFRAAGLVAETTVAGERGYELTPTAKTALEHLRG